MDFPQQIEETLVEKPASYDVAMEPLLESKTHKIDDLKQLNGNTNDFKSSTMTSSIGSILDDNTPSDSGVQLLDSESSELMMESITSQNGFDFDDKHLPPPPLSLPARSQSSSQQSISSALVSSSATNQLPDLVLRTGGGDQSSNIRILTKSDLENSNVIEQKPPDIANTAGTMTKEDVMTTSNCSTFDTENIVYRRRVKKQHNSTKQAPKKRVSFHEDILKNTRTDNIHIEHGFITYKNGRKNSSIAGRYSWCSEGDGEELNSQNVNYDNNRQVVYRNACSDVLDYGNADIYENLDENYLKYDNSGVFEYHPQQQQKQPLKNINKMKIQNNAVGNDKNLLYKCSCSSSNSSLDSGSDDIDNKNSNTTNRNYGQAKSSSCDCIGMNNANNNFIGENCYFSEPSIENINEAKFRKSVWSKEKKPKMSCLKKTKRHTDIIQEHDLSMKMKKFNVHDMNNIIDNSKMIFGSLKSIFTIPLPERGVPEGSEDVQSVYECIPENELDNNNKTSPSIKPQKPFLSKSLDGGLKNNNQTGGRKKFIHNVDEQLRRKNEEDLYAPTRQNSDDEKTQAQEKEVKVEENIENEKENENENKNEKAHETEENKDEEKIATEMTGIVSDINHFRNKFIINCESTVFEHTGVSYSYDQIIDINEEAEQVNVSEKPTPLAEVAPVKSAFISTPIKQKFANILKTLTSPPVTSPTSSKKTTEQEHFFDKMMAEKRSKEEKNRPAMVKQQNLNLNKTKSSGMISDKNSICSDCTSSTNTTNNCDTMSDISWQKVFAPTVKSSPSHKNISQTQQHHNSRHLPSPMKRRSSGAGGVCTMITTRYEKNRMSPDLFNLYGGNNGLNCGRDSKSTILSEEFDDILTITTDTDKNESDIVIIDYPETTNTNTTIASDKSTNDISVTTSNMNLLKPPKSSLINRFLRNVTQKKILESSIRKNNFFTQKIKNENKLFSGNLYLKGVKPRNLELIEDLNAEIAMEIEMSGINSPRRELASVIDGGIGGDLAHFEMGVGEISIEIFNGNFLHILRDPNEILMKVFKLYTGYTREGYMTPVLVFLTDRTLYVTDLVRNRLCNKFVLPYSELDVILMGPYGNTVLLCNGARDMQQVLLAGGPYPANGLVANLELCARRSGSVLPAVGQLTLEHLAPLQAFVRENSSVSNTDSWVYYAVINVPAGGALGNEQEPLGPHIKGFLMHRRVPENFEKLKDNWLAGYFLLKAGVLYMFNDSTQKLPTWAMALAECQGVRRAVKTGRPHCFEILLKHEVLQLAAPDEYVASEWLQALVQSASGLFEMQEKHKTLGCTLVMTENHLITLREDFRTPLRRVNKFKEDHLTSGRYSPFKENMDPNYVEISSTVSSTVSTPTKITNRSNSSVNSTPTKISQLSSKSAATAATATGGGGGGASSIYGIPSSIYCPTSITPIEDNNDKSYTSMSSFYGKNAGVEVLTCAAIKEMIAIRIPSHNDSWWCILEFSCQEVRENSDDLVIFFASSSEMQRFLRMLEHLWQTKNNDLFPVTILDEDDIVSEQCTKLYLDINRAWEPLLSAALGYPQ